MVILPPKEVVVSRLSLIILAVLFLVACERHQPDPLIFPLPGEATNTLATVKIVSVGGQCSAVVIGPDGLAVTASHCVDFLALDKDEGFQMLVLDRAQDLALIRLNPDQTPIARAELGTIAEIDVGDMIYDVGYPRGEFRLAIGQVTERDDDWQYDQYGCTCGLIAAMYTSGGASGSGVYSGRSGRLVGILVASSFGSEIICAANVERVRWLLTLVPKNDTFEEPILIDEPAS